MRNIIFEWHYLHDQLSLIIRLMAINEPMNLNSTQRFRSHRCKRRYDNRVNKRQPRGTFYRLMTSSNFPYPLNLGWTTRCAEDGLIHKTSHPPRQLLPRSSPSHSWVRTTPPNQKNQTSTATPWHKRERIGAGWLRRHCDRYKNCRGG